MRYILDTTVLIDAVRGSEPARSWLRLALRGSDQIGVCAVTIAEFLAGLRPHERPRWQAFIDTTTCLDVTREIARRAGTFQYDYARRGHTIHTADALIAAATLSVGAILVTDNVKDFPMPEVVTVRPDDR